MNKTDQVVTDEERARHEHYQRVRASRAIQGMRIDMPSGSVTVSPHRSITEANSGLSGGVLKLICPCEAEKSTTETSLNDF